NYSGQFGFHGYNVKFGEKIIPGTFGQNLPTPRVNVKPVSFFEQQENAVVDTVKLVRSKSKVVEIDHFKTQPLIISQFRGLGDILFLVPLIRDWMAEGHKIIWPVVPEYLPIQKHFPDIPFVDMNLLKIDYERQSEQEVFGCKVMPLRWAVEIQKGAYKDCMKL